MGGLGGGLERAGEGWRDGEEGGLLEGELGLGIDGWEVFGGAIEVGL